MHSRAANVRRMTVQKLWTLLDFCGSREKTGPLPDLSLRRHKALGRLTIDDLTVEGQKPSWPSRRGAGRESTCSSCSRDFRSSSFCSTPSRDATISPLLHPSRSSDSPPYHALLILLLVVRSSSAALVGLTLRLSREHDRIFRSRLRLWSALVARRRATLYILWPAAVRKLTLHQLAMVSALIVVLIPGLPAFGFSRPWAGLDRYTWFVAEGLAAGSLLAILLRTGVSRGPRFTGWAGFCSHRRWG